MKEPLISIIIPTYNRANLIDETLLSIINQIYKNWECIIIDDGSSDNTKKVIKQYIKSDNRFKFYQRPESRPKGANACRNFGFEVSKGAYINWFDSDDIMLPNFLTEKIKCFKNNPNLDAVVSYGAYFNENVSKLDVKKPFLEGYDLINYVKGSLFWITHGPLWSQAFLLKNKLYDEQRQKLQDTEFNFRMLLQGVNYHFLDEDYLFLIRRGENRISSKLNFNIKKAEDVFLYHFFTFNNRDKIKNQYLKEYTYITSIKTLRSFYELSYMHNSIIKRTNCFIKNFNKIKLIINSFSKGNYNKIKLYLVIFMIILTKKGYKFLK